MFSSPPRPRHDPQTLPVTIANLQRLDGRTRRESELYLKEYAAGQAHNRGIYASQGERERRAWRAQGTQAYHRGDIAKEHRLDGMKSPLLEARVHLRGKQREKETSQCREEDGGSINIKGEAIDSEIGEEGGHKTPNSIQQHGIRRERNKDDIIGEENERKERLVQRRARRRVKKKVISPSESITVTWSDNRKQSRKRKQNEGRTSDNDDSDGTRRRKKHKGKVALGISLMENFNAKNVARGRLTLPPPSYAGLFKKGRASAKTDIKQSRKENRRPAKTFSEFEFLNNHSNFRGGDGYRSSSSTRPATARKPSSPVLSLSAIRQQDDQRAKRPSRGQDRIASPLPDWPRKCGSRRPTPISDPSSDRYSASWAVGSMLPSEDESVQTAPLRHLEDPRRTATIAKEVVYLGPSSAVPSEQASPEVVVETVSILDEPSDVERGFDLQLPAEKPSLQDIRAPSKGDPDSQETTAFTSRFFPRCVPSPDPLPRSPLQISEGNDQPLQEILGVPYRVHTEFAAELSARDASDDFEAAAAAAQYMAYSPQRNTPAPIEGHMAHGVMDSSIYQQNPGLTVVHFIDEHLGPEGYSDVSLDRCLSFEVDKDGYIGRRELMEKHDSREECSDFVLQWDDEYCDPLHEENLDGHVLRSATDLTKRNGYSRIQGNAYERFLLRSQEHNQAAYEENSYHDRFDTGSLDPDAYRQVLSPSTLADEEPPDEAQYSTGHNSLCHEAEDIMLEFSEGRTLLMGMGNGILDEEPRRKSTTGDLHPRPYRLQYGQSVNEIEVMVGKNLGNLWKC